MKRGVKKEVFDRLRKTAYFLVFLFVLGSCEKDPGPEITISDRDITSSDVYSILRYWYLWNQTIPEEDISKGLTPEETLDSLRFWELDKWSFISESSEFTQMFDYGKYAGYGFGHGKDKDGNDRILYVFGDSDFKTAGVQRGWQLISIDGIDINDENFIGSMLSDDEVNTTRVFSFKDKENADQQILATKKEIDINTVLFSKVFNIDGKQTGYIAFQSFLETSAGELLDVFQEFKAGRVTKLILDLRYNSGGRTSISKLIGNLVAGENYSGEVLTNYIYNNDRSSFNFSETLAVSELSLDIDTVVFITSEGTASASELLINGLKPFVSVFTIGKKTSGKPVGMNQWVFKDKALIPVTFKTTNALGEGEYYNGIEADYQLDDDLTQSLGNPEELNLKEAIHLIANGQFSDPVEVTKSYRKEQKVVKNLYDYFGVH